MNRLEEAEKNNILYIIDFQGIDNDICVNELRQIVKKTIFEKCIIYKPIMDEKKYKEYEKKVVEYILNSSNPIKKRKEVYQAVCNEQLIGGFA